MLNQAQAKLRSHVSECERQQQKIRELELELADSPTKQSVLSSLQEELRSGGAKLAAANKKASASQSGLQEQSESWLMYHVRLKLLRCHLS